MFKAGRRVKTAVVTGAAGGIGAAVCTRLLARGYHVVGVDVNGDGLDRLPSEVNRHQADLTDPHFHETVLATIRHTSGRCDLLINNAGIVVAGAVEDADPEAIRREQVINLHAPMLLTHALYPLLQQRRGQIISVASLASMMPLAESPGYSASKAGLRAFMLAMSQRERATGVRICLVHPGAVDTPMLRYEAAHGGSSLNFLSAPLAPDTVAKAVVDNLDHPRLETSLPRSGGWQAKLLGLAPGLLGRMRPILDRAAQSGVEKYLRTNAVQ